MSGKSQMAKRGKTLDEGSQAARLTSPGGFKC